jgi:hypothetical protein
MPRSFEHHKRAVRNSLGKPSGTFMGDDTATISNGYRYRTLNLSGIGPKVV